MNDEIGADAEHRRLQQEPYGFRHTTECADHIRRAAHGFEIGTVGFGPPRRQRAAHIHRRDGFGIAAIRFHQPAAHARLLVHFAGRRTAGLFGDDREPEQNQAAGKRGHAQPKMNEKAQGQEDRHPRQIDDGNGPGAGQKAADLVEIAQWLLGGSDALRLQSEPDDGSMDRGAQMVVEQHGAARDDARANEIEHALKGVGADQHDRQSEQGGHTAARQHAVVNLKHVKRTRQHQQVHGGREHRDAPESASEVPERGLYAGMHLGRAKF